MRILRGLGTVLINIYALIMLALPKAGLFFLSSCVFAGGTLGLRALGANLGPMPDWMLTWLKLAWKIELIVAAPILLIFMTMRFQHCCVGMERFRNHLRHTSILNHLEDVLAALCWPISIFIADQNMRGWMLSWFIVSLNALDYWAISRWQGTRMDVLDLQQGTSKTHYIHPEDSAEELTNVLADMLGDKD